MPSSKKGLHLAIPMDHSTVPQQHDSSSQVPEQMAEEGLDISALEIAFVKSDIQGHPVLIRRQADGDNGRYSVLPESNVETRCLAFGCPGTFDIGNKQEAPFIQKHQMGTRSTGFFIVGHRDRLQRAICSSSLWRAQRSGF